jgi:hypothetical protein
MCWSPRRCRSWRSRPPIGTRFCGARGSLCGALASGGCRRAVRSPRRVTSASGRPTGHSSRTTPDQGTPEVRGAGQDDGGIGIDRPPLRGRRLQVQVELGAGFLQDAAVQFLAERHAVPGIPRVDGVRNGHGPSRPVPVVAGRRSGLGLGLDRLGRLLPAGAGRPAEDGGRPDEARQFGEQAERLRREPLRPAVGSAPEPGNIARTVKTGRNAPCPCGSGKKFKKCCGSPVAR